MKQLFLLPSLTLFLLSIRYAQAVHFSELFNWTSYRFNPCEAHAFADGTLLVSGDAYFPLSQLTLHPSVRIYGPNTTVGETKLIARIQSSTLDVLWSIVITSLCGFAFSTIDHAGNTYVAGTHAATNSSAFSILKYTPDGVQLWNRTMLFSLTVGTLLQDATPSSTQGATFEYLHPDMLILAAESASPSGERIFHMLQYNTLDGSYNDALTLASPEFPPGQKLEKMDFATSGLLRTACFLFRRNQVDENPAHALPVVQCASLRDSKVVTRELEPPDRGVALFSMKIGIDEMEGGFVRVVYERATNFTPLSIIEKSEAQHELVVLLLDLPTLTHVRIEIVKLPTPEEAGCAVDVLRMTKRKEGGVWMLMDAYVNIGEALPGGEFRFTKELSGSIEPAQTWIVEVDKEIRLRHKVEWGRGVDDGFNHLTAVDLAVTNSGPFVYGLVKRMIDGTTVRNGPLKLYEVPYATKTSKRELRIFRWLNALMSK